MILDYQTVLITGGTGSFGRAFLAKALTTKVEKVIIFSRDELKQSEMAKDPAYDDRRVRYFIGDVRDRDRLLRAFHGVDYVVSAAALKQVGACEYNPIEAKRTNIDGACNVIDAAIDCGVRRVVALSTDKATNPVNAYGASKLFAEKLYVAGNAYAGMGGTRFSCVRYGNIAASRGSVIPLFRRYAAQRLALPITHPEMTRFWFTLPGAVDLVLTTLKEMQGGETFVPKLASFRVEDLAEAIDPGGQRAYIGIQPGEKLHESMIGRDESHEFKDVGTHFVRGSPDGKPLSQGWDYNSGTNEEWLTTDDLHDLLEHV